MQDAQVVLEILRDRGRRHLPVDELYRQLFNPSLYLLAWAKIYANDGALTPGASGDTADGMSMDKINSITELMRYERYQFTPVRRVLIPKKKGGMRPLGMPSWSDKLVGEVMRLLLEAYYEPRFSDRSHGFRPGRGCQTALTEIQDTWTGTTWFIEADIRDCFGSLDHDTLLTILAENIHDGRFLELVRRMLKAGYIQDWEWEPTPSGAPQGGVLSPILSNIYLDKLDKFVETELIPEYTRGTRRAHNREYTQRSRQIADARKRGDRNQVTTLEHQRRQMPTGDTYDPGYRRLRYCRYADDQLLGFIGPKAEADQIKQRLGVFLRQELKLELSDTKTLVTHARKDKARFLGYDIRVGLDQSHRDRKHAKRSLNGRVLLAVPAMVITAKAAFYLKGGKSRSFRAWHHRSDYWIVGWYGAVYRGVVNYYKLAYNLYRLGKLRWIMETSMLKTLAGKHRISTSAAARKYRTRIDTPRGPRTCFQAQLERPQRRPLTAWFGEVQLNRDRKARILEPTTRLIPRYGVELAKRVRTRRCELCDRTRIPVETHQVKNLNVLDPQGQRWEQIMARKHRKTLIVCADCHAMIHHTE